MSSAVSQECRKSRTLVLCFDGTKDEYNATNTNVVKLVSLLNRNDPTQQVCYYQAGIGTYFQPGLTSSIWTWIARVADEAVAWYLDAHVMEGYTFLMQNYCDGDKICLFGFSRGAYTARALGGMLFKVGLLPKDNTEQVPFAYKLYKRTDSEGIRLSAGFKNTFSQDVNVEFMGVWDTVSSVGLMKEKNLPFTSSNSSIKTFRHALSIDERRAKYRPNLYHRSSPNPSNDPEYASPGISGAQTAKCIPFLPHSPRFLRPLTLKRQSQSAQWGESSSSNDNRFKATPVDAQVDLRTETDVLEVWFPGCHSDVGGGSVIDTTKHCLSQITLRWMVRQIVVSKCGIVFDDIALARHGIDITSDPMTSVKAYPKELEDDKIDAVQPIHDALKTNFLWWPLEVIPTPYMYQDGKGVWHRGLGFHFGKGRDIPDSNPKFHISVNDRISDKTLGYTPKAKWNGAPEYVE